MLKRVQFSFFFLLLASATAMAAVFVPVAPVEVAPTLSEQFTGSDAQITTDDFLSLTPRKIRDATGKKLTLKQVIGLKLAQKKVKQQIRKSKKAGDATVPKGLFIVCAIFLPIAAVIFMGVADDWEGNTWWTALILYALCYIPGLIYTLTKVKNYY